MREVYVNIGSVEKAKGLNGILRKLEGDFDLVQGRATIDAKSFLGILSMDLSQTVKLIIHDSDSIDMALLKEYMALNGAGRPAFHLPLTNRLSFLMMSKRSPDGRY